MVKDRNTFRVIYLAMMFICKKDDVLGNDGKVNDPTLRGT